MFSPGILVDGTLYVAGQTGSDLKTHQIPEDFEAEVKLCLDNIGIVLKAAGMSFDDAVADCVRVVGLGALEPTCRKCRPRTAS